MIRLSFRKTEAGYSYSLGGTKGSRTNDGSGTGLIDAVTGYNKAQYGLYTALGNTPKAVNIPGNNTLLPPDYKYELLRMCE